MEEQKIDAVHVITKISCRKSSDEDDYVNIMINASFIEPLEGCETSIVKIAG